MGEERIEEQEQEQAAEKKPYRPGAALKFAAALLLTCLIAAGLLVLLAWVSFQVRFSADVVRAGLVGLYVLPGLAGGRILRGLKFRPAPLWGAGLGAAYFLVLFAVSWIRTGPGEPAAPGITVPLLCAAGGLLGGLFGRKKKAGR